jgi:hypothetical protein
MIPTTACHQLLVSSAVLLLSAADALPIAQPRNDVRGPRIHFVTNVFEFGTVMVGEVVKHDFTYTNTGDQVLVISELKSSCGCTGLASALRPAPPGQSGVVAAEFHTSGFTGPVAKGVTVICNDTSQPPVTLEFRGTIHRPFEVTPPSAAFTGSLDSLESLVKTVKIVNQEAEPLTLSPPETTHRAITADLRTNTPGREYELTIRLAPPLGSGNVFGDVKLKTSVPKLPLLTVPVWVVVQPAVMVLPATLVIPRGPLTNPVARTVSIRRNGGSPLVLSEPQVKANGVKLELTELKPGEYFTATLTFPAGFSVPKGETPELSIKSNHPKFPVLHIPIVEPLTGPGGRK